MLLLSCGVRGRPLLILLAATIVYIVVQNLTGVAMASLLGFDPLVGLLTILLPDMSRKPA